MKLFWDETGKRTYETGVKQGVLYPLQDSGLYNKGFAWNGLTAVTESPSGAEASPQYADNIKYLNLISAEEFGATVEAFTYPDEFAVCDGSVEIAPGVVIGQQNRKMFGLSYRTTLGNDTDGTDHGYKLHLVYGALAAPSDKNYATINDSPEAITFSWELTTTPVAVAGFKPTASVTIDSTKTPADKLAALELILYGNTGVDARLPLPNEVATILVEAAPTALMAELTPEDNETGILISSNITITFNNKIYQESIMLVSSDGDIIPIVKTLDSTGKILTINPVSDLNNVSKYLINMFGIIDIYNQVMEPLVVSFTTA